VTWPRWGHGEWDRKTEKRINEADISAKHPKASQEARVSLTDEHPGWSSGARRPPSEGPAASRRLILPVHGRAAFARLRRPTGRAAVGPIRVRYVADGESVHVAFAIGRSVGHAVVRNRLRRRLREILRGSTDEVLPPGLYLIHATPEAADLSYQELTDVVTRVLRAVRAAR
jgi:ribonuclease P protein component